MVSIQVPRLKFFFGTLFRKPSRAILRVLTLGIEAEPSHREKNVPFSHPKSKMFPLAFFSKRQKSSRRKGIIKNPHLAENKTDRPRTVISTILRRTVPTAIFVGFSYDFVSRRYDRFDQVWGQFTSLSKPLVIESD